MVRFIFQLHLHQVRFAQRTETKPSESSISREMDIVRLISELLRVGQSEKELSSV